MQARGARGAQTVTWAVAWENHPLPVAWEAGAEPRESPKEQSGNSVDIRQQFIRCRSPISCFIALTNHDVCLKTGFPDRKER